MSCTLIHKNSRYLPKICLEKCIKLFFTCNARKDLRSKVNWGQYGSKDGIWQFPVFWRALVRVQVLAFYTKQAPGSEITSLCTKAREMTDQLTGQLLSMTKQKKKVLLKSFTRENLRAGTELRWTKWRDSDFYLLSLSAELKWNEGVGLSNNNIISFWERKKHYRITVFHDFCPC